MFDQHALDLHDLDSNFLGNGCLRLGRRCRNCRVKSIERFTTISEEKKIVFEILRDLTYKV